LPLLRNFNSGIRSLMSVFITFGVMFDDRKDSPTPHGKNSPLIQKYDEGRVISNSN